MKRYFVTYSLLVLSLLLTFAANKAPHKELTKWVNPLIGSGGHGHVFVGANVPHGMVQLGPNNLTKGWDWCSGYHDTDSTIVGFAHTHLSGTGIADLGDILFQPFVGADEFSQGNASDLTKGYVSKFQKRNEIVRPGYYSVLLDKNSIRVDLTSSIRVGYQRYRYPHTKAAKVILDLNESTKSLNRKGTLSSQIQIINDSTIQGFRYSNEWANDHRVYFVTRFSKPILSHRLNIEGKVVSDKNGVGENVQAIFEFGALECELMIKTALSYTSCAGALLNLEKEGKSWNFEQVAANAKNEWENSLSKIDFVSKDEAVMRTFYTGLYHTQFSPTVFNDVDGKFRGADGKIYQSTEFTPYTIFSLWDTYRAFHPLANLIDKERANDYTKSLYEISKQQKSLPIWHLVGNETGCMVGVHSIPVLVDAALKGVSNLNKVMLLNELATFADRNDRGLKAIRENQYIPAEKEGWSVAKALEYAIDDYAIAQLAKKVGNKELYEKFSQRATYYSHYFDAKRGFMRGKKSDGSWTTPFDPSHSLHLEDDYVEGNAWQYTWLVPHDVKGLINLFGGRKPFTQKLDSLFLVSSKLNEGASIDITGLIGQYAHGNEPSHHILYLYAYVGEQWKTAEKVRQVFSQFYNDTPNGLIGNEDCGQMSAWYIFSSLGFYPVNPVNGAYVFGSPIVDKAVVDLGEGKKLTVIAKNNNQSNKYIQSVLWNGKSYSRSYITHQELSKGGVLTFVMGPKPNKNFASKAENCARD